MAKKEPSYVDRVNGLTGHVRSKVREVLMREAVVLLKEGNGKAATRIEEAMNELLAEFPSVQPIED